MLVAGEDDIVLQPRHARQDALARRLIARPAVEIDDLLRLVGFPPPVERHHRDLLRKGVPCGAALRQIATEPFFLRLAAHLLVLGEDVGTSGFETVPPRLGSDEPTSELQSLMRSSYTVVCLHKQTNITSAKT